MFLFLLIHGLALQHGVNLLISIVESGRYFWRTAILLDQVKPVGSASLLHVQVGDSSQQRTQDDLGVILEEVDLYGSIAEVHDYCSAGTEPSLEQGIRDITSLSRPDMSAPALRRCSFI